RPDGGRAGTPVAQQQRSGLQLSEAADGRDSSELDFLRLFRFEQAGERGVDAVEVVEGKEANGDDAGGEWRLRIGGGLGGLRKEAVNRTAGFHVPLDAAKALAGTLQSLADADDYVSQNGTCLDSGNAGGREHALHLRCLA